MIYLVNISIYLYKFIFDTYLYSFVLICHYYYISIIIIVIIEILGNVSNVWIYLWLSVITIIIDNKLPLKLSHTPIT